MLNGLRKMSKYTIASIPVFNLDPDEGQNRILGLRVQCIIKPTTIDAQSMQILFFVDSGVHFGSNFHIEPKSEVLMLLKK